MPRRKATAKAQPDAAEAAPVLDTPTADGGEPAAGLPATDAAAKPPAHAADPRPMLNVSLSDHQGGPSAQLLRSHRFNQMQVRFNGEQPSEPAQAMLRDAGWKDRTEAEGVYTKQIDRDARWQSVAQMEQEFKAVANAIREAKGLEPAMSGPTPA